MYDKSKTDPSLGLQIQAHLEKLKIATPMAGPVENPREAKVKIQAHFRSIMELLGLDLNDDSLIETPKRIAHMYTEELMWGLRPENFPKITVIDNKMGYDEMIIERDAQVMSLCEHHFVTIEGKCHVAYLPEKKVLGLSKINRVVEYFSRRPQVQERLTVQIAETLKHILETDNVAVVIEARHYCVISRGVEDTSSETVTSSVSGKFRDPNVRLEFFNLIRSK